MDYPPELKDLLFIKSKPIQMVDIDPLNFIKLEYFNNEKLDTGRFVLHHMSNFRDLREISTYCSKLKNQHRILSTQVIILILQKWSLYENHLHIIRKVQKKLTHTVEICRSCRRSLNLKSSELIFASLKILYFFRKRKVIGRILKLLHNIKKVHRVLERLQQMLIDKSYPKLVSLILEFQKAMENQRQYICVTALHQNLSDILEQVETNLDISLSNISEHFDINIYASIFTTYSLLGKSQATIDQLHMYFIAAIHNASLTCILKYVKTDVCKQFSTICRLIPISSFIPCLLELCKSLLNILNSYCLLIKWHNDQDNKMKNDDCNDKLSIMNQQYVSQILENGIIKICCDIRLKIKTYLDGFDLKTLKIEDFFDALIIIKELSKNESLIQHKEEDELYKFLKKKFLQYLHFYQVCQLDELKTYLENDGWALCPVKSTLNFHELDMTYHDVSLSSMVQNNISLHSEITCKHQFSEDSDDGDIEDDLEQTNQNDFYLKSILRVSKSSRPIITNTTLGVLKVCMKYVQAIKFLEEDVNIILLYIRQLFELYFYGVHSFFASDLVKSYSGTIYTTNLKRSISYIKDNLILEKICKTNEYIFNDKIRRPQLSLTVDLISAVTLFGLKERIIATESLIFFGLQLESIRHNFNSLMLDDCSRHSLDKFYCQIVSSAVDIRKPIYTAAVSKIFQLSDLLPLINNVDWEQHDVACQHSYYIDFFLKEIFQFKLKLTDIQHHVPFNADTMMSLWDCVAYVSSHLLVDAFSTIKKCSNGGRALMQLDFTQFILKYESITSLKPMPHQTYVASYIKAFYLPEISIEMWIKEHPAKVSTNDYPVGK
ncbi:syndetin isoform X2 [Phymastichus coffea]|uniref:syndetin isoform X2 n=1 Tax=Phymastichus coffea TaxID=108790 RepID=UPI00273B809E|nr:syndetin isoform X2 [Phymastichus coffea]XP_058789105.1 syndetin isoform X2 [Phymastichus coffea]